ncbi:MAG: glycosyltransferase family 2 protein [Lyngbya sp. HA4199-MV5]|jgi:glycosyltransferase involved in cell wall biosynthesis|nr:glycosyltransferase family 2 protein [Lyngbya sp. HA4199-MV5]
MTKLLSIAIPTYNRAPQLHTQLTWLAQEIKGFENECDITVYDNCSTDHTQAIIHEWQQVLGETTLKSVRNQENIGGMRNLALCLSESSSRFTWTLGDDDPIDAGTIAFIIQTLRKYPDLGLLYLNYSAYYKQIKQYNPDLWLPTDFEQRPVAGKAAFQRCIEGHYTVGGVIFLSATIFRSEFAQIALQMWPESVKNWGGMAFWTGYCAAQGDLFITQNKHLVCIVGASQWESEKKIHTRCLTKDIPEVCWKLQEIGYSHQMSRRVIAKSLGSYFYWCRGDLLGYLRPFKDWPLEMVAVGAFIVASLGSSALEASRIKEASEPVGRSAIGYTIAAEREQ